ncbi:UNVERIFIED_CONTAM: hypothetical protein Slati_0836800 [Sesamum latifolium]|uniref:Uncharacterized protein n=1 Tax=Sesamum latifolium TaxID=2727402 RepID=A0AAW2XRP9_9LAMI
MCDLGASINVMPLTIFESLHVGPLKEIGVVIQLADRSVVYPEGVSEDVLVQVNELVFSADFYVLDMRKDNSPNSTSILLGRPFLKTARTKIDVHGAINGKDYIKFALEENSTPMQEKNMDVDPLVQVNAKFDGDSAFTAKFKKDFTSGPRTYKKKAFHNKISLRKNSLMNLKVFIGPRHLRKHYIEETDPECPTYSS